MGGPDGSRAQNEPGIGADEIVRAALTFPRVQRDVMRIPAGRQEDRAVPVPLGHFKTKDARVEAKRPLEVRNF